MKNAEEILAAIARAVESEEEHDLRGLSVDNWFGRGGDEFHVTITRVNPRNGYEKRIAIPRQDIVPLMADMIRTYALFVGALHNVQKGG
jgi:hypothetical protein